MNKNNIREIVEGILDAADELLEKPERDLVEEGRLIAYAESLSIIRDACAGYDLREIGLDFDIDAKYLV
jgi:hypothetical protein